MGIVIELNEITDGEVKRQAEEVILGCIGSRPEEEKWQVWIHASYFYSRVVVKGPKQTRDRYFFEDHRALPEAIRNWLDLYPLK